MILKKGGIIFIEQKEGPSMEVPAKYSAGPFFQSQNHQPPLNI